MTLGNRLWQGAALVVGTLVAGSALAVNLNPTTEPRLGPNHLIVFAFDKPVTTGVATVSEGVATLGAVSVDPLNANALLVPLTGVTDLQCVTVDLSGVVAVDGGTGGVGSVRVGFMAGDVTQNRKVQGTDLLAVSGQFLQPVTAANYLEDVNVDGFVKGTDLLATSARFLNVMPAGCP